MHHALTVLNKNISTCVTYNKQAPVASIELAHVSSDDQGFLIMGNYVNDN
jgi:hypothetical protein